VTGKRMARKRKEEVEVMEYFYSFELLRHYPHTRSFILKRALKSSMKDALADLILGTKKR
jgi:hypothetical protein